MYRNLSRPFYIMLPFIMSNWVNHGETALNQWGRLVRPAWTHVRRKHRSAGSGKENVAFPSRRRRFGAFVVRGSKAGWTIGVDHSYVATVVHACAYTAVSSWQLSFYVETGNRNRTGRWKEGTKAFLAFSLLIAGKIATHS